MSRVMFQITGESNAWTCVESPLTYARRPNIYFNITSPTPGTFIIALHYKGREKAILEMDLKIDDLLEKVRSFIQYYRCKWAKNLSTAKRQQAFA